MKLLDTLQAVSPTYERENIYGSGFKRLAMLEAVAGRDEDERQAIAQMLEHYGAAEAIAHETGVRPIFYPAMNRIAAQLALAADAKPLDEADITAVRKSMQSVSPDFWSVVGQTELKVFASMAAGQLSQDLGGLIADFGKHHERVSNSWMWGSVLDTANFVSSRYRRLANESEKAAADKLLGELKIPAASDAPCPAERSGDNEKSARKSKTRAAKPVAKKGAKKKRPGKKERKEETAPQTVSAFVLAARFARLTAPFRRVREIRRERNGRCPAPPSRSRSHPIQSDRGSCRWRGRPPIAPCPSCCRGGGVRRASPSGSSSARSQCSSRCDTEIAKQRDGFLVRVFGEDRAHEILGNLGKDHGRGNRRVERDRAGDRIQIGEANADRHGSAGPAIWREAALPIRSAR